MERSKSTKSVQGGGSGEGLEIPAQVREEDDAYRSAVSDRISRHVAGAVFNSDLFDSTDNNDAEIWKKALSDHLKRFVPSSKKEGEQEKKRSVRADKSNAQSSMQGKGAVSSSAVVSVDVRGAEKGDRGSGSSTAGSSSQVPMRQEIPKLPSDASELVQLWLHGCEKKGI